MILLVGMCICIVKQKNFLDEMMINVCILAKLTFTVRIICVSLFVAEFTLKEVYMHTVNAQLLHKYVCVTAFLVF